MSVRRSSWIFWLLALVSLFSVSLGVRRAVVEAQAEVLGPDFPFTLESALHYRRVKMVYDTGQMPAIDKSVGYPDGVDVRRTYEFGSEYLQAALAKMLPDSMSVTSRLRWVEAGFFSLGAPLLALWIYAWKRKRTAAFLSGLLYAVAVSSVVRSTGQELSKENLALPLLIAHLLARVWALRAVGVRRQGGLAVVSSLLLAWSLAWWDMIQFYVALWALEGIWRVARGRISLADAAGRLWFLEWAGVAMLGVTHPYYSSHGLLLSPFLLAATGGAAVLIAGTVVALRGAGGGPVVFASTGVRVVSILILPVVSGLLARYGAYESSYGHFAGLLWAKLRFLNVKPADPSLLTFEQRIMWVPALDSATIQLTFLLFPAILLLSLAAVGTAFRRARFKLDPDVTRLVLLHLVSVAAYVLFVRFHVYVALFSAAITGWWLAEMQVRGGWRPWVASGLCGLAIVGEAGSLLRDPKAWGRHDVYYKEIQELTDWLRTNAAPDVVLANFGTSGAIAAYGKCPVILHPKFETREIRDEVEAFGNLLFKGTEREFRDWADAQGAVFYVHALGEFASRQPELQMRYFVDALEPGPDVPARRFEFEPQKLELFRREWGNRKYVVYRVTRREDEFAAAQHGRKAEAALQRGDLDEAEEAAVTALRKDPREAKAQDVMRHVMMLREKGFTHDPARDEP